MLEGFSGVDELVFKDIPFRSINKDEVRIQVKACGINNKDIYIAKGIYYRSMNPPVILGSDIAGIILEVGSDVKEFSIADRVVVAPIIGCGKCDYCVTGEENKCGHYGSILGGFSEEKIVNVQNIVKIPEALSYIEAAALPISYLTAWNMLFKKAKVKKDDTVLFWGASSGVGTAGILLLNDYEQVIALAGSEEKIAKLKEMGIKIVINYKEDNVSEKVMAYTDGQGVDVIFDPVGAAAWKDNFTMLKNNGKHVNCARNTGSDATVDLALLFSKQLSIYGAKSGTKKDLEELMFHLVEINKKPIIDKVFPLKEAKEALLFMESGKHFGKVVLKI